MEIRNKAVLRHALLTAAVAACALPLAAQTGATATLLGTVTDPTNAVVAGVTITATNTETKLTRAATTEIAGEYTVFSLPIGHYDIRAQAPGFRTAEKKDVTLTIDQRARIDFQLVVGETRETVTITGETPILKTDDSSTSQVITQRAVVDLPLNGRNFMQLTRLTASVNTEDGYNITSGSVGGFTLRFGVSGHRPSPFCGKQHTPICPESCIIAYAHREGRRKYEA